MKEPTAAKGPGTVPVTSLDRALDILETVAAGGPDGMALGEIAAETGFNKGSVHRLLAVLLRRGYVVQGEQSRAYALGETPHRLVRAFGSGADLPALFRPLLLELSRQTEELVHLGALDGRRVVYLDKVEPERSIRVWSRVGRRVHIATTSLGRAMFAAGPQSEAMLTGYVDEADPEHEQPDLCNRFRAAVDDARVRGWAIENQENEPGVACVGVALVSPTGEDAAVSVTGLSDRMDESRLAEIGALMRNLAARLAPEGYRVAGAVDDESAGS